MKAEMIENETIFEFWKRQEDKFPFLSKCARKCLSRQATSVSSEQLFSVANDLFDYRYKIFSDLKLSIVI